MISGARAVETTRPWVVRILPVTVVVLTATAGAAAVGRFGYSALTAAVDQTLSAAFQATLRPFLGTETSALVCGAVDAAVSTLFHVTLLVVLLTLPGWFCVECLRKRYTQIADDHSALLSLPFTSVAIAALVVVFQNLGAPPSVFTICFFAIYGGLAAALVLDAVLRDRFVSFAKAYRHFFLLQILIAACATFYVSVGLEDSSRINDWMRVANRNVHAMPIDNDLSWITSQVWRHHFDPNQIIAEKWKISDRGALYSVLHTFFSRALEPTDYYPLYVRLGIVLNGLFVGPLYLKLREWSGNARMAWACTVLVALNPWFFLNIYYTWPKLFGAYFLVAAWCTLWNGRRPTLYHYAAGGFLFGLGVLTHGGHLLSLPVFYLTTIAVFDRSLKGVLRSLVMPLIVVAVQVPWSIYKHFYSPDTYNLIVFHYLGNTGYFRPLSENFANFMRAHPMAEQLAVRKGWVVDLWWAQHDWTGTLEFWRGKLFDGSGAQLRRLYAPEFLWPMYSAGLLWFPWIGVGAIVNIACCLSGVAGGLRQHLRAFLVESQRPETLRSVLTAVVFSFSSLTLNAWLRWLTPHTHELPYLETLLIAVCGVYLLRYLGWFYWLMAAVAVVARQQWWFAESARSSNLGLPTLDINGVLFWVTFALLILLCFTVRPNVGHSDRASHAQC